MPPFSSECQKTQYHLGRHALPWPESGASTDLQFVPTILG